MQDTYQSLTHSPFLWIAVAFALVLLVLNTVRPPSDAPKGEFYRRAPSLLRKHYWLVMLVSGLILGVVAIVLYLFEIAHSVMALVDRLEASIADETTNAEDVRHLATATALLLGALAASATLLFQLVRVWINERTTTATEEGLITDRINKAVEALGTEKTVTRKSRTIHWNETKDGKEVRKGFEEPWGGFVDIRDKIPSSFRNKTEKELEEIIHYGDWITNSETQPNLEVRIGGIYALERIAQDSDRDHVQIMEILCAYIRQNAPAGEDKGTREEILRSDIQTAVTVIGRRSEKQITIERSSSLAKDEFGYRLDLRNSDLQGAYFNGGNFKGAILTSVRLTGANLSNTCLDQTHLWHANLERTALLSTEFRGAHLSGASLRCAHFDNVKLDVDGSYHLADISGAGIQNTDFSKADVDPEQLSSAFGDASVTLPEGIKPGSLPLKHWSTETLGFMFHLEWQAWQKATGFTPDST